MNFGRGFFCRVGLSLGVATLGVAALVYLLFNFATIIEKLIEIFDSFSGVIEGVFNIPGLEFVLMAIVSFVLSLTIVLWYVEIEMPYDVAKMIISDPSTYSFVSCFMAMVSIACSVFITITSASNMIWLFTFVSPAITFLVIVQYDIGCYKKVCRWITKQD